MAYARAYAEAARAAYRSALDREVLGARDLGMGLIGLGAVAAGLAAFGAHKDALTGAALLGGSAMAIGNWNLSKQRQLIYIAGLESINCAVKAIIPFDMAASEQERLRAAIATLEAQVESTGKAIERVEAEKAKLPAGDAAIAIADEATTAATAAKSAAQGTLTAGKASAETLRKAGAMLVVTVDQIGVAVDKAVLGTLPDINSVKDVVRGLGAMAGSFAPGAGLEASLATAFGSFKAQSRGEGQPAPASIPDGLARALAALGRELQALARTVSQINGLKSVIGTDASLSGLSECGVQVSFPLVATPAAVEMTAGKPSEYSVVLSGGTAPFTVKRQGGAITGLTLVTPFGFDRTIHLSATDKLAGPSGSLLVTDAAMQTTISIPLTIKAAQAAAPAGGTTTTSITPTDPDPLVARIKGLTASLTVDGIAVTVIKDSVASQNGKVTVPVTCAPAPPAPLAQDKVVAALLAARVDGAAIGSGAEVPAGKIVISGTCVIAAVAQSRSFRVKPVPIETLKAQQRSLCLTGGDLDGLPGPTTQAALERWRGKNKSTVRPGAAMTPDEEQALKDPDGMKKWCGAG